MPETRFIEVCDGKGNVTAQIPYEVSDEQLAEEQEIVALAKVDALIDSISNLAEAKIFLKRLCARLIKRGVLP